MSSQQPLAGRVSIITGASRGIGAATARALAQAGSHVALLDLEGGEVAATAQSIAQETGVRAQGYAVDVRRGDLLRATIDGVAQDFGAIDHLVNNAGVQFVSPLADFPDERWEFVTAVNLDGVFYGTKAVWPHMLARGRGRIVNIASVHGLVASPFKPAYVAAKHGVVGLTRASALEGALHGITVNAVCPGVVMTDLIRKQAPQLVASYGGGISEDEALSRAFLDAMPTRRFIEPEEVAQLCVYLCSDAARSITGAPISIDGGWAAH
jgi:3-hydroxybutyrate dehydrogenase